MGRPVLRSIGAAGAEKWPIRAKNGPKMGEFGLEKWGLRPILVDGCSRSGPRSVELFEAKLLSQTPSQTPPDPLLEIHGFSLV